MSTDTFQRGQTVRLSDGRTTVDAVVVLASFNGKALTLTYDGIVAQHVAAMAVLFQDGGYRSLVGSHPVSVEAV
jgi:hypothetical protein